MTKANGVVRESYSSIRGRSICISVHPTWVEVWLKGTRKKFQLDDVALYQIAAKAEAEKERRDKRLAKMGVKK